MAETSKISKYVRRAERKLARRIEGYNLAVKRSKHPNGLHKPGSKSTRKAG